jgi:hypothetical protein
MKYLILFILLLFAFSFLCANIIVPGPYANELMWIDGTWYLELKEHYLTYPTLQDCYIFNNEGFSYFNGVGFPSYNPLVVTIDDLYDPLQLNSSGDEIEMGWDEAFNTSCHILFGDSTYCMAPLTGESLVRIAFGHPTLPFTGYRYCRDNSPTLYFSNDDEGFTGTFCGSVTGPGGDPVGGAVIEYYPWDGEYQIVTDLVGEFSKELYTVRYDIQVIFEEVTYIDTTICVAPDSVTTMNFILPITSVIPSLSILKKAELNVFPNPFNPSTNISFDIPIPMDEIEIEIFNSKDQNVKLHFDHTK